MIPDDPVSRLVEAVRAWANSDCGATEAEAVLAALPAASGQLEKQESVEPHAAARTMTEEAMLHMEKFSGIGRNVLEGRIEALLHQLRVERIEMSLITDNLTATQARCTELLEEGRRLLFTVDNGNKAGEAVTAELIEARSQLAAAQARYAKLPQWGVWCEPSHPDAMGWPSHWWGQSWKTADRIVFGKPHVYDEATARKEAGKHEQGDTERAYRYEARPLPTPEDYPAKLADLA